MISIHNNIPVNILSTTDDTRARIITTHAIRTMDIGYSVSQHSPSGARSRRSDYHLNPMRRAQ